MLHLLHRAAPCTIAAPALENHSTAAPTTYMAALHLQGCDAATCHATAVASTSGTNRRAETFTSMSAASGLVTSAEGAGAVQGAVPSLWTPKRSSAPLGELTGGEGALGCQVTAAALCCAVVWPWDYRSRQLCCAVLCSGVVLGCQVTAAVLCCAVLCSGVALPCQVTTAVLCCAVALKGVIDASAYREYRPWAHVCCKPSTRK